MTRKDYVRLSSALSRGRRMLEVHGAGVPELSVLLIGYDNAAQTVAHGLAEGNPAFDETRFIRDAGAAS